MFGSNSFSASSFSQSPLGPTVAVTGVSAKGSVPIATEEHGGAFAENSFAEAPFASEKSQPFFITVNTVANVSVTGLEATAQSNGVVFNETINLTGLGATASVGSASVSLPTSVAVTGLQATMPVIAIDRRDLAMECGKFGRFANRENLLSVHGRFLLSKTEATDLLDGIVETVRSQWRPAMRRAGVSDADCNAIAGAFLYEGFFYEGVT